MMRLSWPLGARDAYSRRISTLRRLVMSSAAVRVGDSERSLQFGLVNDHVSVRELTELEQLGVRESGLRGAAPAEDHDLGDAAGGEHLERVVGGVGGRQLLWCEHEHACDVQCDVAVSDHHCALGREQIELQLGVVGVAVVPADELGGRVRSG